MQLRRVVLRVLDVGVVGLLLLVMLLVLVRMLVVVDWRVSVVCVVARAVAVSATALPRGLVTRSFDAAAHG